VRAIALLFALVSLPLNAADEKPVSFFNEVVPVFKKSCTGCHHPGKLKGQLDLTTYDAAIKGGKNGALVKPGDAKTSMLMEEITGEEPSMPKEGDPLSKDELALIEKWIAQGAKDDTPASAKSLKPSEPPTYLAPPVISAFAWSPDGKVLAVSGYHEVLLHDVAGSNVLARLLGESPRVESLAYSTDGKLLGVAGSAPALFGEVQIWNTASNSLEKSFKVSSDSIYGLSFSPKADRVAIGCADKTVRILAVADGKELLKFDNHSDWVFGTLWTVDGKRLLTGSRDKAMKMLDASNGQFIDDINKLIDPILCIARHPKEDTVAYGGEMGFARTYKISDNQGRTAANNDVNLRKEFERLAGPVHAIAYNADGSLLAVGGAGPEVRVYNSADAKRVATLKGHGGAIFALAFNSQTNLLAAGGFDGNVRLYETTKGELVRSFVPVPIKAAAVQQAAR
jgi:WD40 repeat protein/mono/diheme cytochrome c family protein